MKRAIPLLNLKEFISGEQNQKNAFVSELTWALKNIGFVGIVEHGIPDQLVADFYSSAKQFFSLPESVKRKYVVEGLAGQRGYTAFGKEHAKHSNIADLKEFFQIGQTVVGDDDIRSDYPDNLETLDVPLFSKAGDLLYKEFEASGAHLLRAIALGLDLDEQFFDANILNGNSILRAIHYPPIIQEPDSAIRAEQHEDINLITLLVGASAGGLQILSKEGDWLDISPQENEIVVNVGDMLQRLTNNMLKSTTHRVVNPTREFWHVPRLSIPFFLHPRRSMNLRCLDSCINRDNPIHYEAITAGEYLNERLCEIGLKK
ncbi:MAG: 2-oxoglutarate and iron-dependent oxygenase domain-containing protein [Saprospiraceae bacterium]